MPEIRCPICASTLRQGLHSWTCPQGHCFDVARQGYVNLLPVTQKHALHPGDTREQVAARRAFLDGGFYAPIAQSVCQMAQNCAPQAQQILDVGCGEGYYSAQVSSCLPDAALTGLDISKEAVRFAAGRYRHACWLCGTAAHLPFPEESFDLLLCLFAPAVPGEFARVLRPGGVLIHALAAEDHLLALKQVIYPTLLHREKNLQPEFPGFRLMEHKALAFSFAVSGAQIQNLLAMTPHYWRITQAGAQRLSALQTLSDRASTVLLAYKRT